MIRIDVPHTKVDKFEDDGIVALGKQYSILVNGSPATVKVIGLDCGYSGCGCGLVTVAQNNNVYLVSLDTMEIVEPL